VYQLVKARRLVSGRAVAERCARLHDQPVEPRNLREFDAWLTASLRRGRRGKRRVRSLPSAPHAARPSTDRRRGSPDLPHPDPFPEGEGVTRAVLYREPFY